MNKNSYVHFFIKEGKKLVQVKLDDIFYVKSSGDYTYITTNKKVYKSRSTLKGIESKLPVNEFIRVHNSYIVRLDKISIIERSDELLVNKIYIPMSLQYRVSFFERIVII